ncbi:nucleoside-diphosphate kinase [Candidatus Altiarchaeota archaeon]
MKTLIIIKPDGVSRKLVGEILSRFEKHSIKIIALKILQLSKEQAERMYSVHKGKEFYNDLVEYITSGPVVAAMLKVEVASVSEAVAIVRKIVGLTNPAEAEMGSIRGDYGLSIRRNIIHASDSEEAISREMPIFFDKEDLVE